MGKSIISVAIFNSYVCLPEGNIKTIVLSHKFLGFLHLLPSRHSGSLAVRPILYIECSALDLSHTLVIYSTPRKDRQNNFGKYKNSAKLNLLFDLLDVTIYYTC